MFGMLSVPVKLQREIIIADTHGGRNEALSAAGCAKILRTLSAAPQRIVGFCLDV
jgi:hypothetical protein